MPRDILRRNGGSLNLGPVPEGCRLCARGSKMVLFVTGLCDSSCYYCPLSEEKRGRDVIYADEMPVTDSDEVLYEARAIRAEGAGISGGDPLCFLNRTVEYIQLLKREFGSAFHIHLYTSMTSLDGPTLRRLVDAGLDEIRFHPQRKDWKGIQRALATALEVGIEVPVIPGEETHLKETILRAERMGVSFVNMNELEASETNFAKLTSLGMRLTDTGSASIEGSKATAKAILDWGADALERISLHYCSARYKDGIQMRHRLERRLEETIRDFEQRDESDPLLILGVIRPRHGQRIHSRQLDHLYEILRQEFGVPREMMNLDGARKRIEIASWILEGIVTELREMLEFASLLEMGIAYEYPTWDRLQTLFEPL